MYYNAWGLPNNLLLPAIESLEKHRAKATKDLKFVVCFVCHGSPGTIEWDNGLTFTASEILESLSRNKHGSINLVFFFSCLTFLNLPIPRGLPFSVCGYVTKTFVDQSPYFLSRLLNEYCRTVDLKKSIDKALKYSDLTRNQIKYRVWKSFSLIFNLKAPKKRCIPGFKQLLGNKCQQIIY